MADKSFFSQTKDKIWFQNFWYYYKIHIIVSIIIILFLVFSIHSVLSQIKPDLEIVYSTQTDIKQSTCDAISDLVSNSIDDIDKKDGKNIVVNQYLINPNEQNLEMTAGYYQSLSMEINKGDSYLYILDNYSYDYIGKSDIYEDISSITKNSDDKFSYPLSKTKLNLVLNDKNEKLRICIKKIPDNLSGKKLNEAKLRQNNAIKALEFIIK